MQMNLIIKQHKRTCGIYQERLLTDCVRLLSARLMKTYFFIQVTIENFIRKTEFRTVSTQC